MHFKEFIFWKPVAYQRLMACDQQHPPVTTLIGTNTHDYEYSYSDICKSQGNTAIHYSKDVNDFA